MAETAAARSFADYLAVGEAARFLGVSPWTLRNWDNTGKLKSMRHPVSGHRLYRQADLESLLDIGGRLGHRSDCLSPRVDWDEIGEREHFVQFYEHDRYLVDSVAAYVERGFVGGEAALVIATRDHRKRIHRKLKRRGIDIAVLRETGQYLVLDAAETLSGLMVGDDPDVSRFDELLGPTLQELTRRWPRVRAFGEMVSLLWESGNRQGACRLEALWNDLARRQSFALFCAYPLSGFDEQADGPSLNDICTCHTRVIPAESYSTVASLSDQMRTIAALQQKAQRLEAEIAQRTEAERELSDFLEHAIEGLHKVGPDGTILWANKAELDLLGYERDEFIGRHISDFHVDPEVIAGMMRQLLSGENLFNQPARLRCKDGSVKEVLIHSSACFKDGRFRYSSCFTRDVTEIKQAARDRAMLAAIVESSQDAIISKTFDGIIRSWNSAAERLFGYTESEAIGQSITMLIPRDRLAEEQYIIERLRRGESIEHYDTIRLAKDGTPIDISLTISPIRDREGNLIGASKIARDISDRKQADIALRASEHRFSSFMQSLPGAAWIKDTAGTYLFANDAVQTPFGRTAAETCGKTDEEIFPPETAAQFRENDRRALNSPHGVQVVESLEQHDGTHYSIVSKFPIPNADGEVAYVGGVAVDITDRMRAEEALKEADRRKDEFLATLAHELRNPLAPIRNSLHILRLAGQSMPEVEHVHDMIERQVAHMVRLVDDLLELSRISRGTIELQIERIELGTVIRHAVETSQPLIDAGSHTLEVSLPERPVMLEGDLVRLAQVFANLLNNAAKYTEPGGTISVAAQCEGDEVVLSVRDTGVGIPRHMLSRVFEMFSQVDGPLRRSQEGLGIGLSLARSLVAMHGGRVEAYSAGLGRGSQFTVWLPRIPPDRESVDNADIAAETTVDVPSARKILVVDDNKDSADSLAMLLKFLGAEVTVVYGGRAALEALQAQKPAVILMDLGMPGMNGCDAARMIREDPANQHVVLIAMTGWGQEEDRRRSRDAGFDHHLVKPIDLATLQTLLAECVG